MNVLQHSYFCPDRLWANDRAKPARAQKGAAIIHVHGGWFNWGTAKAFRNFVGHIALSGGADAFIQDYRLAPEDPFPAAVRDLEACYRGLVDKGITKISLTGDSAGGNLALVLLSIASAQASKDAVAPVGAVVFSPITDLALTGEFRHASGSRSVTSPSPRRAVSSGPIWVQPIRRIP